MIAAPPVLLRAVIRVCTDPETAYIIDNVLNMLCVMYRGPSGCVAHRSYIVCLVWSSS